MFLSDFQTISGVDTPIIKVHPMGSFFTCSPPVTTTDRDYLILVENVVTAIWDAKKVSYTECLREEAYECANKYGQIWASVRKDNLNLIFTQDLDWFYATVIATEFCKSYNIQSKSRRVRICKYLRHKEPLVMSDLFIERESSFNIKDDDNVPK